MSPVDRLIEFSRRGLLKAGVASGAAYAMLGAAGIVLGRDGASALELKALSPGESAALMRFTRDLFPHHQLAGAFYANAIAPLDEEAAKDPAARALFAGGIEALDAVTLKKGGRSFAETPKESERLAAIGAIEGSPFFVKVYGTAQTALYNQPDLWPVFGFEGPSSPFGGYLHRGFDDLDWL